MEQSIRTRLYLAAGLAVVAAVLFLVDGRRPAQVDARIQAVKGDLKDVNRIVDTLLARYGIQPDWIRTWQVQSPQRAFFRTERRVYVPPEFISVNFNHDLSSALTPYGARVVATERSKENTVTVHIKQDETIIESIAFVLKRSLRGERSGSQPPHIKKGLNHR